MIKSLKYYILAICLSFICILQVNAQKVIANHEVVFIKGGWFERGGLIDTMGTRIYKHENTFPVHKVFVSPYYIGKYEVTYEQYCKFLNSSGFTFEQAKERIKLESRGCNIKYRDGGFFVLPGYEKYPVAYLSWEACDEYCKAFGGRLPTEAEWQFAATGGQKAKAFYFNTGNVILESGVVLDNFGAPQPVGSLKPNEFGIYDMLGNIRENCSDWYDEDYYKYCPKKDPQGPEESMKTKNNVKLKVMKGGAFNYHFSIARPDLRSGTLAFFRKNGGSYNSGFRICFDSNVKE